MSGRKTARRKHKTVHPATQWLREHRQLFVAEKIKETPNYPYSEGRGMLVRAFFSRWPNHADIFNKFLETEKIDE